MRPALPLVFVLAFVLSAVAAWQFGAHRFVPAHERAATHVAQAPAADAGKNSGGESSPPDDGDGSDSGSPAGSQWPADAGTPEQVMYAQAALMQTATDQLQPRTPGHPNLYVITFAGDGEENVFRNEAEFVEHQFTQRFDSAGHVITLINNPSTLTSTPLASLTNLQAAIDAVAARMDQEQDILFLFLTTHGSREHELLVSLDPLPLDQIGPEDLAGLFADSHIKHRVIVISACYSGGFIDALRNDGSLIVTAARADRASFGCGTDSDITDFGRAFFVEGLNHNDSFADAFREASGLIGDWETHNDEEHSFPQFVSTPQIETQLKAWRAGIRLGPPLPFKGIPPRPDADESLTASR